MVEVRCRGCRIETALREDAPDGLLVVYLPGVSRKELIDPGRLREELQPLAGLVVRSAVFAQRNGSDWTPSAFLTNDAQGLGLSVSASQDTREALTRSLTRVLECRVSDLVGRALDSSDFDKLLVQDAPRRVLTWLGNPEEQQAAWEADGTWAGFVSLVRKEYRVHPVSDGRLAAARKLGDREGKWTQVWTRFAEAPHTYPGVVDALRMARPDDVLMPTHPDSWPQDNEEAETAALAAVSALAGKPAEQVRAALTLLHNTHAPRLNTVWAALGQTPAAVLVDRLADLADLTESIGAGTDVLARAAHHAEAGWRVDRAFTAALATLEQGHPQSSDVAGVAEALYRPWLEACTQAFQQAWTASPPVGHDPGVAPDEPAGTCALFVDGLRFDVAAELALSLQTRGLTTDLGWGLAGVPTVTATCKPAVTPVSGEMSTGAGLNPATPAGAAATQEALKRLMADAGWQYLTEVATGDPSGRGWTEGGDIDTLGHNAGRQARPPDSRRSPGPVDPGRRTSQRWLAAGRRGDRSRLAAAAGQAAQAPRP